MMCVSDVLCVETVCTHTHTHQNVTLGGVVFEAAVCVFVCVCVCVLS